MDLSFADSTGDNSIGASSRLDTVSTHCPYCAFQCGVTLAGGSSGPGHKVLLDGDESFPVNQGALCIKGWLAAETLDHPERLTTPMVRQPDGSFAPTSWDDALERTAEAMMCAQASYGLDAAGVFGGGSLTHEKAYLLGKFARIALSSSSIDYNGRFCMSSAAAASIRALGIDRGLPFPVGDIAEAEAVLLVGANPAETMPPIMQYFEAQRANCGKLIVVDPRRTPTAQRADLHLALTPGSDAALANGLMHILIRDGLVDEAYIRNRTEGFDTVRAIAAGSWPELTERITGVPQAHLAQAAHILANAKSAMVLTARGAEQQAQGVNNTLAFINIALALGLPGRRNSGYGALTGQGNGQGGREHGQKADQLPGYRRIDDPAARKHVAGVWGVDESEIAGPGRSAYEMLDSLGEDDGVRALLVMGSNVAVSAPNSLHIQERLESLDFLVVADFFMSETAKLADVVLPTAQWAEEEGTITNLEGRVIHRRQALLPPPGVRTDLQVIQDLAERLGKGRYFAFSDAKAVFDELGRASAGGAADYSGITYEKIDAEQGVFWPCPSPGHPSGHPGTPRLFEADFPTSTGRAKFHAVRPQSPAEEPDEDYPLYLTTGRILAHYQSGSQTRRVSRLEEMAPKPLLEVHPTTAQRYGLTEGGDVRLASRRGAALFQTKVTRHIRPDTLFAPFHWGGLGSANRLTNPALDPASKMPEFKICAVRIEPSPVNGETVNDE